MPAPQYTDLMTASDKEICKAQQTYEMLLKYGAMLLVAGHIIMCLGKYFVTLYKIKFTYAIIYSAAAFIYILLCRFKWKNTFYRVKNFFRGFRSPWQYFGIALFFWYIIVYAVNIDDFSITSLTDNLWLIYDTAVNCIILFNLPFFIPGNTAKKQIDCLLHIVSIEGLGIVLYGLWHLFTLDFIKLPSGEIIGMIRRTNTFCLGCHYNVTAAIAVSFILISFYMFATQKGIIRIIYVFALIPHTLALLLANSRAGFLTCVAAYAVALFLILWNKLSDAGISRRIFFSIAASAMAVGLIWISRPYAFQLFESVTHYSSKSEILIEKDPVASIFGLHIAYASEGTSTASETVLDIDDKELAETKTASEIGNEMVRSLSDPLNREIIWKAALNQMSSGWKSFIFGVSPMKVPKTLRESGEIGFLPGHAHNEILQMGVAMGVPAMIIFILFLVSTGIKAIRLGLSEGRQHFEGAYILALFFSTYIVLTLVEAYLFSTYSIMSSLFFLFCGWIQALVGKSGSSD